MNIQTMLLNGTEYNIRKLLGKGKGGYSYLADDGSREYVLKQIHHEPCDYYQFGNKIEAELHDYERLKKIGIRMPKLIDVDRDKERILKEYIAGDTVYQLVLEDRMSPAYVEHVRQMCALLYDAHLNIDYFPTNFVAQNGELFYIDYECNNYMDEWNFENWGIKYWSKTPEFLQYVKEH
ncbi:MAG: serine/threonine-protein kinase [Lachnospiraceae bacterium]|nr:serine/threonine-protein kinase [Lachnospiraceae bacterium]